MSSSPHGPRRILLVDADAFFVTVAKLVDPDVAGAADEVLVGGINGRGVVCSASYAARAKGVHAGMPMREAQRLCPSAVCAPVPEECGAYSHAIRDALAVLSPVVEPASVDEFYCDFSGTMAMYAPATLAELGERVRQLVHVRTGLPVSIGGGTNRLVAKLAVECAKPRAAQGVPPVPGMAIGTGVSVVPEGYEAAFLATLALADIPFIGPAFQDRLAHVGLRTVADALALPLPSLVQWFGRREGQWLYERIRGQDETPVVGERDVRSFSHEQTFPSDIRTDRAFRDALGPLVHATVIDLRDAGFRARTVTVRVRDADFTTRQAGKTLDQAVTTAPAVLRVAHALLAKLRAARSMPARLLGVTLSGLVGGDAPESVQLSLFDGVARSDERAASVERETLPSESVPRTEFFESARDRRVEAVVDQVRRKFGDGALVRGMALAPVPDDPSRPR